MAFGLRFDGTVLRAEYGKTTTVCTNAVDITFAKTSGYGGNLFCLLENGSIRCFQENKYDDGKKWVEGWSDIIYISSTEDSLIGLTQNGNWLIGSDHYSIKKINLLPDTANITGDINDVIISTKSGGAYVAYQYQGDESYQDEVGVLTMIGIDESTPNFV